MTSCWTGRRVRLRAVEPEGGPLPARLSAQEERLGDALDPPRSAEGRTALAGEKAAADPTAGTHRLIIESLPDGGAAGTAVGTIAVHRADSRSGLFEYGTTVGAEHRRRGYATEAVRLVLRHRFEERRHHKATARVFARNAPSPALQRRLGLVEEGRLGRHFFVAGEHRDVVLFALFAEQFFARHGGPTRLRAARRTTPHPSSRSCRRRAGTCRSPLSRVPVVLARGRPSGKRLPGTARPPGGSRAAARDRVGVSSRRPGGS
ncbi:GNAT family N-acetyltransferase [Kitasatospora sp. NPDC090308]|uniref:GNAT family N-acetyltransferase n=1 Tax=Kitasatospora sp. NPDC090308 TaxID=3364082 RepID=UPI00382211A3